MEHITEELAKAAVNRMNAVKPTWFCPVINGICRTDCASYNMASFIKQRFSKTYSVRKAYCSNMLVSGFCEFSPV